MLQKLNTETQKHRDSERSIQKTLWVSAPLSLCVVFLCIIWWTRLHNIARFPFFIDEGLHVYFSEVTMQTLNPVVYANKYYLFSIWWWGVFNPYLSEPIWLARVVTLLAVLPGAAAVIALGRLTAGLWGAALGGLVYLFSTYHTFFERLAMADPISGSLVLVAVYFGYRLTRRLHLLDAILTGAAVFLAIGAKLSALPFLGIPVAAVLTLSAQTRGGVRARPYSLADRLRWLGAALAAEFILMAVFIGVFIIIGRNPFGNAAEHARLGEHGILDTLLRIPTSAGYLIENLQGFIGIGGLIVIGVALIALLVRRQFYLLLCLFLPAVIFFLSDMQSSRYYAAPLNILLVCVTAALASLTARQNSAVKGAVVAAVCAWGVFGWLPFIHSTNTDPSHIPLPMRDYREYVSSDASGFGLEPVRDALREQDAVRVFGILANCQALRYVALHTVPIECPVINPDGRSIPALEQLLNDNRADGVYAVLEALPYVPESAPGTLVTTIDDPSGRPRLSIYRLAP